MMTSSPAPQMLLTADREELKFLVALREQRALLAALGQHLPRHRHRGEGENPLPGPEHFVTTVYFDTPSLLHFQAAQRDNARHVKLRAKEYYDVHPSLAELATDPTQVMHQTPFVWLELKRRQGSRSQKQRVRVERGRVDDWVAGRASDGGAEGDAIRAYCQGLDETLKPFALVNYRRSSWQSADDTLRVTVDSELFFFTAMPDIWGRPSLSRSSLGQPRKREARLLVEVKQRGDEQPAWLARTLVQLHAEPVTYSKFMRAMESATG